MNTSLSRNVQFGDGNSGEVSCKAPLLRYPNNPVLTAAQVNYAWNAPALQVVTVHNAGVTICKGETLMLFRSHLRNGKCILGLARSSNGVNSWSIDPGPVLTPAKTG